MNIKSLLLGSAAALAVVSGAQAADAIVAAEPEPMEYVRVCDAFGTGFFYIPGTETCLKIGGYARFQVDFGRDANSTAFDDWDAFSQAELAFTAMSDTEIGVLEGFVSMEGNANKDGSSSSFGIGQAYIAVGGLKAGYFDGFFDPGLAGEQDELADDAKFNSVAYTYTAESFVVGLAVDELYDSSAVDPEHGLGISGSVGASVGAVSATFVAGYDTETSEAALRAIVSGDVGPGTLGVAVAYATGDNVYWAAAEWTVAASYSFKATDKLSITPGIQYWSDVAFVDGDDKWKYGVTVDYKPVDNLLARVSVNYDDVSEDVSGYFRLQRSF